MSDDDALDRVMNPARNGYRLDILNVSHHSPLMRALHHASYVFESAYEIVVRNAKKEAATVVVREPVPGDWTMLEESQAHAKVAAGTAEWRVKVPAEGSTTLRYRVLVRY